MTHLRVRAFALTRFDSHSLKENARHSMQPILNELSKQGGTASQGANHSPVALPPTFRTQPFHKTQLFDP